MERHFAAGGVVVKKEAGETGVLLIRDSYGHWTWPKGHAEEGESPDETAVREISEETGLKGLKVLDLLGEQKYWYTLEGVRIFKTVHIFLVESLPGQDLVIQKEEIAEGRWFSPEDAVDTIEYEGSRELLKKGIEKYSNQ